MHCMPRTPALVAGTAPRPLPTGSAGAERIRPARSGDPVAQSAIYYRRLTAQVPMRGHRVVAARLSKIP